MKLLFIICVKNNIVRTPSQMFALLICCGNMPWEFAASICRGNFLQLFAVAICGENLPWVCLVYVSKLFFYVSKSFFFVNKPFSIERKPFLYGSKTFFIYEDFFVNSVSFCYCRGSYEKIALTVIPTDLVRNSLLSSFCPFLQTKNKNQVFSKLVVW